jgi:imidazolonepropionase-like amidohydrolase
MVENGVTPMRAIQAATTADADLLGVSSQPGSIAKGKLADIIAVRGDPLRDVRALEDVRFVTKEGRVYKED